MSFSYKKYFKGLLEEGKFGPLTRLIDSSGSEFVYQEGELGKAMLEYVGDNMPSHQGDEVEIGDLIQIMVWLEKALASTFPNSPHNTVTEWEHIINQGYENGFLLEGRKEKLLDPYSFSPSIPFKRRTPYGTCRIKRSEIGKLGEFVHWGMWGVRL